MINPAYDNGRGHVVYCGDALDVLRQLPSESVHCCVTSPPYWGLRDYGVAGQLGLEPTPVAYVTTMVAVFEEVRRVLRSDGTCWVNLGDSYASSGGVGHYGPGVSAVAGNTLSGECRRVRYAGDSIKPKDLVGIPWSVAFALRDAGWYLRQDIIWAKPNPMPESVRDRCTKAHEYLFLLSKSARYFFDAEAIREDAIYGRRETKGEWRGVAYVNQHGPQSNSTTNGGTNSVTGGDPSFGRNRRSVWTVVSEPYPAAHFATFPTKLIEPCILAGCPEGGTVLDPFMGSGTTAQVARKLGRNSIGIELNPAYIELCEKRLEQGVLF